MIRSIESCTRRSVSLCPPYFFFFIFTKYATRTGLKIEIGNRGIYEQGFQERGISQSAEKRSDKYVYVYRVRSQQRSCQYTHENVVSKIVYLSTDFCEFDFFFPFTLTFSLSLFRSFSRSLPLSLSSFLSLFSLHTQSYSAHSDGGCFFISFLFFFLFFYSSRNRGNVFLFHVTQDKTLCHLSPSAFIWGNQKRKCADSCRTAKKYAKLAVLGNISAVKK